MLVHPGRAETVIDDEDGVVAGEPGRRRTEPGRVDTSRRPLEVLSAPAW